MTASKLGLAVSEAEIFALGFDMRRFDCVPGVLTWGEKESPPEGEHWRA